MQEQPGLAHKIMLSWLFLTSTVETLVMRTTFKVVPSIALLGVSSD